MFDQFSISTILKKKKEKKKEMRGYPRIKWFVLVSSIGKVSDGWIKDLAFNSRLHQKLIGVLIWW